MEASARVVAERRGDSTVLSVLRSDPPILLRRTPGALHLVGGAAGPLGGDRLALDVGVGPGARLVVRGVAASLALPGPDISTLDVDVDVGAGGELDWSPGPLVSVVGSSHVVRIRVRMASDSTLRWREQIVLGRTGEEPGALTTTCRIERNGAPLLHHEVRFGDGVPGWDGPANLGGSRAILSEVRVRPGGHEAVVRSSGTTRAARFPLAADASLLMVTANSLEDACAFLAPLSADSNPGDRETRSQLVGNTVETQPG